MTFSNGKGRGQRYGSEHAAERKRRVMVTVFPGDPCGWCGGPLPKDTRTWHLPHRPDGLGYLPGMWHGACNIREAAQRGARIVNAVRRQTRRKPTNVKTPKKARRLTW